MRNSTKYCNSYIRSLIKSVDGTSRRCSADVLWAVEFNRLVPVLTITQDYTRIFCEKISLLDLCENMHMSVGDIKIMLEYYEEPAFQRNINDIEYEEEYFNRERQYAKWMAEELEWYNHARMMGWE